MYTVITFVNVLLDINSEVRKIIIFILRASY